MGVQFVYFSVASKFLVTYSSHAFYIVFLLLFISYMCIGRGWRGVIGSGVHSCKGLIAVITKEYINSDNCTNELDEAANKKKKIFPIRFEDVDLDQSEKSRGVKLIIGPIQWSSFRPEVDNYDSFLSKLVQGLTENGKC